MLALLAATLDSPCLRVTCPLRASTIRELRSYQNQMIEAFHLWLKVVWIVSPKTAIYCCSLHRSFFSQTSVKAVLRFRLTLALISPCIISTSLPEKEEINAFLTKQIKNHEIHFDVVHKIGSTVTKWPFFLTNPCKITTLVQSKRYHIKIACDCKI